MKYHWMLWVSVNAQTTTLIVVDLNACDFHGSQVLALCRPVATCGSASFEAWGPGLNYSYCWIGGYQMRDICGKCEFSRLV